MEEELLLVTSPTHPLARKRHIVPDDLRGQHFVLFESGSNTRRALDEFFVRENLAPSIVMETENVEIIKALVRTNVGITICRSSRWRASSPATSCSAPASPAPA